MPSFGQKLKLEREKRAITLEQISLSTKIGTRMLQALEEENFNQLPGGIFNKGFVRAYARHVGLDEDQTVADYLQASGQDAAPNPDSEIPSDSAPMETDATAPSRQIPRGVLAAILLTFALALFLWTRSHKRVATSQPPGPNAGTENLAQGSRATPSVSPGTANASAPAAPLAKVKNASAATAPTAANLTPVSGFTVVILAREDSWLSITVDGKPVFEDTLVAENQRVIQGQKEIVIRAGNTGALDFLFNGKKLPSQGDYGEVKTLTFGVGGLQPNAPRPPVPQ